MSNLGPIYSVIALLMISFMIITFDIFWSVIKNNTLHVVRTGNLDGGGLFFPNAINQLPAYATTPKTPLKGHVTDLIGRGRFPGLLVVPVFGVIEAFCVQSGF
ncbi:hypothetical protein BU16DRAFT_306489 [Lophium mytilinum]|uniref:Uncharacterized protein n=1 Tax=Lophium mytilinum TaxID=390894 RepID=A0A6A6R5T5_9PEZI|nr:hypothetical protein BU16DRAFT_306489 [Lophium mytilinum]